jgi:serine protease inhibitor
MKRFLIYIALVLLLRRCRAEDEDTPVPPLIANHRDFADTLTAELYSKQNECTSAWGVSMAFSLIYPGTVDPSTEQIRNVLGYPICPDPNSFERACVDYVDQCQTDSDCLEDGKICCLVAGCGKECMIPQLQLVWNNTTTRMTTVYDGACLLSSDEVECSLEQPTLEIANSVWIDDGSTLRTDYAAIVGSFARQIDFEQDTAGGIINAWVNETTKGLIESIFPEEAIDAALIAVNSIYLKASWLEPFQESFTNEDTFYSSPSRVAAVDAKAHFMHKVEYFPYSHDALPGFQVVQLPFPGDLSMIFVLPLSVEPDEAVTSAEVLVALQELARTRLALAIPKFKFESEYKDNLKKAVQDLGISAPFFPGTLCLLENDDCSLFISEVIQKTVIDVNEKGVEAAAVTAVTVVGSAPYEEPEPMLFLADHPFQFFIYDTKEELVIFEGQVGNPGISDTAEPAQFNASHTDDDFWSSTFGVEPDEPPLMSAPMPDSSSFAWNARRLWVALVFLAFLVL